MLSEWTGLLNILVSLYEIEIFSFLLKERKYPLYKGLYKAAVNTLDYAGT